MISRCFNPYLLRHFNPCFEHFQSIHLSFSTLISKTSQPIYRRHLQPLSNLFSQVTNVIIVKFKSIYGQDIVLCLLNVLDNDECSLNEVNNKV